jgi:hypothetical protein
MKIYDEVKLILEKSIKARNSDWELFEIAYKDRYMGLAGMISWTELKTLNLESYRRARQKVQELHPELQASKEVQEFRNEKENYKGVLPFNEDGTGRLL